MREKFKNELKNLKNEMIEMGTMIEQAIEQSVNSLVNNDYKAAENVIKFDSEIDHKEKEIENICLRLIMEQQPVASDLREISAALKMITDMERIGDHASDISEIALLMDEKGCTIKLDNISSMAKETTKMLINSIDAYVQKDIDKAREVINHDDVVDQLFLKVKSDVIELIHENSANGEQAADILMVAKYFERIGDHATNISEWVIFSITGINKYHIFP